MSRALRGRIRRDEASFAIRIRVGRFELASKGRRRIVVDTGFSGAVSLPFADIRRMRHNRIGVETYELADGATVDVEVYAGEAVVGHRRVSVPILSLGSEPLLGMQFLTRVSALVELDFTKNEVRLHP